MPGMRMSLMIRSGRDSATRIIASRPRRAVCTSYPSARSVSDTASKRPGSSSTTNNCFAIVALLKVTFIAASVTPHREVQFKCAALPNLALDGDAAPHLLHYVSRQIQAKADAGNIGVFQKF